MLHFRNLYKSFLSIMMTIKSKNNEKKRETDRERQYTSVRAEILGKSWCSHGNNSWFPPIYISKKQKTREKAEKVKPCLLNSLSFHPSPFSHFPKGKDTLYSPKLLGITTFPFLVQKGNQHSLRPTRDAGARVHSPTLPTFSCLFHAKATVFKANYRYSELWRSYPG